MDRVVPHADPTKESHNIGRVPSGIAFGATSLLSAVGTAVGNATGLRTGRSGSRGVVGEGADHGEAGLYFSRGGCEGKNQAREDHYIDLSVQALQAGNIDLALNKLGDAAHVSADRGSHGEGIRGRGHDTPAPGPNEQGTQFPNYMEKFDDCDNRALNPDGYAYGLDRTEEMLRRFLRAVP
jgi:hypothetical protein